MSKKSVGLAVVLGLFAIGFFYVGGFKKGLIAFIAASIVSWLIASAVSLEAAIVVNLVCAFICYKWAEEYNAAVDQNMPTQP